MNNKISNILVLLCLVVIICLIVVSCANQRQENIETITSETTNSVETEEIAETITNETIIGIETEEIAETITNETIIGIETEESIEITTNETTNNIETEESIEITTNETTNDTEVKMDYKIYTYSSSQGGQYESSQNERIEIFNTIYTTKKGVGNKLINFFGDECNLFYTDSVDFGIYDEGYDNYSSKQCMVQIGEKTGRIISYGYWASDYKERYYDSPVNAHSSRQDFVNYAAEVLSKYSGISTDDCDIEIKTTNIHTTYKYTKEELNQGFVNFVDQDPSFSAEYEITFYRKFGGLNRIDDISVTIRNNGVVTHFRCKCCDEKFEKFSNVEIDEELVVSMINKSFNGTTSNLEDVERTETKISVVPNGDNLWIFASIYYKYTNYGERFGGAKQYLISIL